MLSQEFGYVESRVSGRDGLNDWPRRADDLTLVKLEGGAVTLGARRFREAQAPELTVENVAAIHRGYQKANDASAKRQCGIELACAFGAVTRSGNCNIFGRIKTE